MIHFDKRQSDEDVRADLADERYKAEYLLDSMRPLTRHNVTKVPAWCEPYLDEAEMILMDQVEEAEMAVL